MLAGSKHHYLQERVIFGVPAAEAIPKEAERLGAERVFITTTRWLGGNAGIAAEVAGALGSRHVGTYAGISAHAPREQVVEAAAQARAAGAELVVSIGGGSVTDGTKVMLRCLWENIDSVEKLVPNRGFGAHNVAGQDPTHQPAGTEGWTRMIAVPTTYSSAEFNFGGSVMNTQRQGKDPHAHPLMVPVSVVLDPAATQAVPLEITLSSGFKILSGAVGKLCSVGHTVLTEMMPSQTIRHLPGALRAIKADPADREARLMGQLCTWWSRADFYEDDIASLGHGVAQVLGGFGASHSAAACVSFPAVLRWNAGASAERQRWLAGLLGDVTTDPAAQLLALAAELGLPTRIRDLGISRDHFPAIAERTAASGFVRNNPRPVTGPADILEILEIAW